MREPAFWYRPPSFLSRLLAPLGAVYGAVTARRMSREGLDAEIPVICIGNYHVGGAGKTPATLKIAEILRAAGETPFVVSRGYGGKLKGPVRVQSQVHTSRDVGDEPLMMSSRVPVVVSRRRVAGARLAKAEGASVILLDDGFQNPALKKNASLIVIDGSRGLGNASVFPAGPLRAPLAPQLARTDALIVVGEGDADGVGDDLKQRGVVVLRGQLEPDVRSAVALPGRRVLAFAGIGDPARFFRTLRQCGADVVEGIGFADHHVFKPAELKRLEGLAQSRSLMLVTTEKDMARIRSDARLASYTDTIATLAITMEFEDESILRNLVIECLAKARA
jgi:tetraacyldisaccharide 4'-kinase